MEIRRSSNGLDSTVPVSQDPYHHASHEKLLALAVDTGPAPEAEIDAIIVPTVRPPGHLAEVFGLAQSLGCKLVTLHSGDFTSAVGAQEIAPQGTDLLAIDFPGSRPLPQGRGSGPRQINQPSWRTSELLAGTAFERRSDLSCKRNLGLMISHMAGWGRILFLDDDITGLDAAHVRSASGLLDDYNVVGLKLQGFPDHSVVCLAFLEAGGDQRSFVGGGALVIKSSLAITQGSFFPDIYNEDWFFLLDGELGLQPTARSGKCSQRTHDPFRDPQRARDQELGEVLAEGIYWLLDQRWSIEDASHEHWKNFLERRRLFILHVMEMVSEGALAEGDKERRLAALRESLQQLARITPEFCDAYLQAWHADRSSWRRFLEELPTGLTPAAAAAQLTM